MWTLANYLRQNLLISAKREPADSDANFTHKIRKEKSTSEKVDCNINYRNATVTWQKRSACAVSISN